MSVITRDILYQSYRKGEIKENSPFHKGKSDILTPSAREFLASKQILVEEDDDFVPSQKPEELTHLHDGLLVPKNHPRIVLRGKLDRLESEIIFAELVAKKERYVGVISDLEEIIKLIRKMIRCEVKDEPLPEINLLGLTKEELREHSHHLHANYGIHHFLPSYTHGETVCALNKLRTLTREVEISAFNAFLNDKNKLERTDILTALNRLSSSFFIMMAKVLTDRYEKEKL